MAIGDIQDISYTTPGSESREQYTDVGASAFHLGTYKRLFFASGLSVWDAASGGNQLTLNTDYELTQKSDWYSKQAAKAGLGDCYTTLTVLNATYQTGSIYITYDWPGTIVETQIIEDIWTDISTLSGGLASKTVTAATYTVTDADMEDYDMIEFDTTSNAIVVTMADRATNNGHRIILKHAIQDVSLDIVTINRAGTDTITADALTSIELPKVGNYIEVFASSVTSAWEILSESITSKMRLHTYAGYGSSDTMIMRFTTKVEYIGNMFTQNHDSGYNGNTEGLIVTVNRSGKYGCQHSFLSNLGQRNNGLSLNSAQLSTSIASITVGDRLNHTINTRTYFVPANHHATYDFVKGDFICPHGDADTPIEAVVKAIFTFVYLGQ